MGFRYLWTVKVTHDYFESLRGNWVDVIPTQATAHVLRCRGIILKRTNICEWSLIRLQDEVLELDDVLEFYFTCTDKNMVYKTIWDWSTPNACRQIEADLKSDSCIDMLCTTPGGQMEKANMTVVCKLRVPLEKTNPDSPITTQLHFTAKSCYWEYWLIPRNQKLLTDLVLEIEGSDILFHRMEDSHNPLNVTLAKFRTTIPLKLTERSRERISLYERPAAGVKRPILRNIPVPEPGRFPFDTVDTAIAVCYF